MPALSPEDLEAILAKSKFKPTNETELIGYARVSTEEQNLDMQLNALRKVGVKDDFLFSESVSGVAKKRPRLAAALKACRPGDVFVVWRLDRLGRSMRELLDRFEWFQDNGIGFRSITETVDTTTPIGQLYIHLAAAFAQFERQLISYRTTAGVRRAMERGQKFGAPKKIDLAKARKLLKEGKSARDVAKACKVSPATIYNHFPGLRVSRDYKPKWKPKKR